MRWARLGRRARRARRAHRAHRAHRAQSAQGRVRGWRGLRRRRLSCAQVNAQAAGQCVAGGMLCSYWKTLCGSYFALTLRNRGKLRPQ